MHPEPVCIDLLPNSPLIIHNVTACHPPPQCPAPSSSGTSTCGLLALLWRVPVQDEPRGVNGSDEPAVGAEHVKEQHAANGACGQTSRDQFTLSASS